MNQLEEHWFRNRWEAIVGCQRNFKLCSLSKDIISSDPKSESMIREAPDDSNKRRAYKSPNPRMLQVYTDSEGRARSAPSSQNLLMLPALMV
jgi:hypothetical protein